MWLACYTIQKGARKWQRYHVNIRGGIVKKQGSGSYIASSNLVTLPNLPIVQAYFYDGGFSCVAILRGNAFSNYVKNGTLNTVTNGNTYTVVYEYLDLSD